MNKSEYAKEVGMVSAIISDNIMKKLYETMGEGYIAAVEQITEWATQFVKKHKNTNWEEVLFDETELKPLSKKYKGPLACWDDAVIDFAWYKYEQYCKNH